MACIFLKFPENINVVRFTKCEAQLNYVLNFVEPKNIKKALEQPIPSELFDLYQLVFDALDRSAADAGSLARKVLSWVYHAKRPLHIAELQEALAIEAGDISLDRDDLTPTSQIVQVSGSFIRLDSDNGIVRFSHDTMGDFLRDRHSTYLCQESDLAVTCLTYLLFETFAEGSCTDEESFALRLQNRPFGKYAARYWGRHMKGLGENDIKCQQLLVNLAKASPKVDCMTQLSAADRPKDWDKVVRGKNIWHLLAENDLTILGEILVQGKRAIVCTPLELIDLCYLGSPYCAGYRR